MKITAQHQNEVLILLKTIHGSRLYGLNHAQSDYDTYSVFSQRINTKKNIRHTIQGEDDVTLIPLSVFMYQIHEGVPQALEALYSTKCEVNLLQGFSDTFTPSTGVAIAKYRRGIKSMALGDTIKKRRHAVRLTMNLNEIIRHGRFNPTLKEEQIRFLNAISILSDDSYFTALDALSLTPLRLFTEEE